MGGTFCTHAKRQNCKANGATSAEKLEDAPHYWYAFQTTSPRPSFLPKPNTVHNPPHQGVAGGYPDLKTGGAGDVAAYRKGALNGGVGLFIHAQYIVVGIWQEYKKYVWTYNRTSRMISL